MVITKTSAFCDRGSVCVRAPSIERGARTSTGSSRDTGERARAPCVRPGDGTITKRVKTQLTMLRFNGLVNRIGGPTDAGELVLV